MTTSATQFSTRQTRKTNGHEAEDDLLSASSTSAPISTTMQMPARSSNESVVEEVVGDAFVSPMDRTESGSAAALADEVGTDGTESGEEFFEATPEQLSSASSGEETALADLRGIEGFEEAAGESTPLLQEASLSEAGAAIEGGQEEFLPILAALVPTLVSTIGPSVAKAVVTKLSPRAQQALRRRPVAKAAAVVGKTVTAVSKGAGGKSNILALVASLLKNAEAKPGYESGAEVDETFATEAAAALEVIIGTDDRVRINATTQIPWRRLCALRITFPSGSTYRGTGFLIGPRAVATAGHCVYLHNQGGWARRIEVIPGSNGSTRPFGQAVATAFRSVSGWVASKKPEYDIGCIMLPSGSFGGRNLGSFGFAAFDPPQLLAQPAVVAGYPGDKPFAELWGMSRKIKTVTARTLIYDIDSMGGQSGAPVYIMRSGQRYVVGIHNYGAATGNSATRVTPELMPRFRAWSAL